MKKLNIAIIGCGRISKKHAEAIANNYSEVNLISVCDLQLQKMNDTVDTYCKVLEDANIYIDKANIKKIYRLFRNARV